MPCPCDTGRKVVALVTTLAHDDEKMFQVLLDELEPEEREHAVLHLVGIVVGLLRQQGDARLLLARLGPRIEAQRGREEPR